MHHSQEMRKAEFSISCQVVRGGWRWSSFTCQRWTAAATSPNILSTLIQFDSWRKAKTFCFWFCPIYGIDEQVRRFCENQINLISKINATYFNHVLWDIPETRITWSFDNFVKLFQYWSNLLVLTTLMVSMNSEWLELQLVLGRFPVSFEKSEIRFASTSWARDDIFTVDRHP